MSETANNRDHILKFINTLLFETSGGHRFTQDSPILPNVWVAYALDPTGPQDHILTLHRDKSSGQAARILRKMLQRTRQRRKKTILKNGQQQDRGPVRMSYIPGQIAVSLYFDEMMRIALPLTPWWDRTYLDLCKLREKYKNNEDILPANWVGFPQPDKDREKDITDSLMLLRAQIGEQYGGSNPSDEGQERKLHWQINSLRKKKYIRNIPIDFSWLVRIAGVIGHSFENDDVLFGAKDNISWALERDFIASGLYKLNVNDELGKPNDKDLASALENREAISKAFTSIYKGWSPDNEQPKLRNFIWRITKNRSVNLAVAKSALTVKADAARRLFNVSAKNITWAVIDSGIDGDHDAFKNTTKDHETEVVKAKQDAKKNPKDKIKYGPEDLQNRIVKTLDFTDLRDLLDMDVLSESSTDMTEGYDKLVDRLSVALAPKGSTKNSINKKTRLKARKQAKQYLKRLLDRIRRGRDVDWEDLEPLIVNNNPKEPVNDHGTHVAGILGADWIEDKVEERTLPLELRSRRMQGVCPEINIIDVRVFRDDGKTDEFELLAAVQFLRWMNSRAGYMVVHGANLSLSLIHEVRRFACGRTPICDECNEASALGMVMVAAAGNRGFEADDLNELTSSDEGFKAISITDPGNAQGVITVGATHRKRPQDYGVSYFSSRGPTGDGRLKPDIVAPGEKIKGPISGGGSEYKDGTSMAAPHVSGAAALLMARHSELVGQPVKIKEILCSTATDLGRERYFQGHGLLDVLRALQSI